MRLLVSKYKFIQELHGIDVEFPLYFKYSSDKYESSVIYRKINIFDTRQDDKISLQDLQITISAPDIFEIKRNHNFTTIYSDDILPVEVVELLDSKTLSDEQTFNEALELALIQCR